MKHLMTFLLALCFLPLQAQRSQPGSADREMLDKAIDYFASQKYHEALLLFEKLDERFRLNPRYLAYMGYCYYFDWDYASAATYLAKALPQLQALSPHELSVYYFSLAESLFELSQYDACVEAYEQHLVRCYPDERADALYRLGFVYLFRDDKPLAWEYFTAANECYRYFQPERQQRIQQLQHMLKALPAPQEAQQETPQEAQQEAPQEAPQE